MLAELCLAAASWHARIPADHFQLRWRHSIEKVVWTEDYEVAGTWLLLSQARIHGSGAGMEPPPDATLIDGTWRYRPTDPWRSEIVLARSEFVPDYRLCTDGQCQPLTHWIPIAAGPTRIAPCGASPAP